MDEHQHERDVVDGEIVDDPSATALAVPSPAPLSPALPDPALLSPVLPDPVLPDPDYSESGVPGFDFVRDKIENRYTTSLGSTDVAGLGTENTAEALDKKIADREQAGKDRLAEIRRSMLGE